MSWERNEAELVACRYQLDSLRTERDRLAAELEEAKAAEREANYWLEGSKAQLTAARAEVERLKAELEVYKTDLDFKEELEQKRRQAWEAKSAEFDRLQELERGALAALSKYGQHLDGCKYRPPPTGDCSCGEWRGDPGWGCRGCEPAVDCDCGFDKVGSS